jgi:HPt (histidine-containing phosphotransfer) domain-containing protein
MRHSKGDMGQIDAANRIESLAEMLVLLDASQSDSFTGFIDAFTELAILVRGGEDDDAVEACARAVHLVEATAQGQVAPESTHGSLCGIIGNLQHTYCHGLEASELKSRIAACDNESDATPLSPLADDRILGEFLPRQEMVIDELEGLLLGMEKEPQGEALHRCRRLVHTLKGESSLLGMIHVERVCHAMEEALTLGRVDALFQAKDWLSGSFALYAGKKTKVERSSKLIALLTDKPESGHEIPLSWTPVAGAVQGEVSGSVVIKPLSDESWKDIPESLSEIEVMPGTDPSLLSDFLNESSEHLESIDVSLMTLESDPSNMDCLNAVFRDVVHQREHRWRPRLEHPGQARRGLTDGGRNDGGSTGAGSCRARRRDVIGGRGTSRSGPLRPRWTGSSCGTRRRTRCSCSCGS